jgi:nitrite reductase/ring-hydroxylating ferredoxin subunit
LKWAKRLTIILKKINLSKKTSAAPYKRIHRSSANLPYKMPRKTLFCPFHRQKQDIESGQAWTAEVLPVRVF